MTQNSIASKVTYDKNTDAKVTRPENIDGNWSTQGFLVYNTSIDSAGYFNINTFTNLSYNNSVGYANLNSKPKTMTFNDDATKSITKTFGISERLGFSFRNDWLEVC